MKNEIIRPNRQQERDRQVPEFGGYQPWELRHPVERESREDVFYGEAQRKLRHSAVERSLFFSYGIGRLPHVQFPNAEHFQHIPFTQEHWRQYGNLESEYARLHFVLDNYPNRGFPKEFAQVANLALRETNVLGAWDESHVQRERIVSDIYDNVSQRMHEQREHEPLKYHNGFEGAYQSAPIFYESSGEVRQIEKQLWLEALTQISAELQAGNPEHLKAFLDLHASIKDPITQVRSQRENQVEIFLSLYKDAQESIPAPQRTLEADSILIAQLALESSFLSQPGAKDVFAVIYGGHHELPYAYVDVSQLPRGELANPGRVRGVLREILDDSERYQEAVVTPIMVSYYQEPHKAAAQMGILDGNNRATALLLFRYLDSVGCDRASALRREQLDRFVKDHDLAIAWERDLALALQEFKLEDWEHIQRMKDYVKRFAYCKVPALLVDEPNFITIAVAQSDRARIVPLQPMHQALYNQRERPMAIPSKQQSHGRSEGNDIRIEVQKI
ncbi:MAG TPA: hypothetical protein VN711_01730 [Candidatus Saccharimonadales bacterium]|nr:hypothetical protein [Candidatus Saccharimonadales bacterium]